MEIGIDDSANLVYEGREDLGRGVWPIRDLVTPFKRGCHFVFRTCRSRELMRSLRFFRGTVHAAA